MDVSVKVNISEVFKAFDQKTQLRFQRNAFDRTVRLAGKETKKRITTKYNLKAGDVKIKVTTSRQGKLVGYLQATARKFSLTRFNPVASMGGLTASILKGQTVYIEDAFIAQPHGKDYSSRGQSSTASRRWRDVFMRKTSNAYPLDAKDIKEEYSMSVGEYLKSDENMAAIRDMLNREKTNIERAVVAAWSNKQIDKILDKGEE